jgi:hypothetical protein
VEPPDGTVVGAPVERPDQGDRERAMVAVSSEVVTARAAAVRSPG